jgi:hypothetical protein
MSLVFSHINRQLPATAVSDTVRTLVFNDAATGAKGQAYLHKVSLEGYDRLAEGEAEKAAGVLNVAETAYQYFSLRVAGDTRNEGVKSCAYGLIYNFIDDGADDIVRTSKRIGPNVHLNYATPKGEPVRIWIHDCLRAGSRVVSELQFHQGQEGANPSIILTRGDEPAQAFGPHEAPRAVEMFLEDLAKAAPTAIPRILEVLHDTMPGRRVSPGEPLSSLG